MTTTRLRLMLMTIVPLVVIAALGLGYFSYVSASRLGQLQSQSLLHSTLLLVDEKIDRVEQQLINADNAAFHLVDLNDPKRIEERWPSARGADLTDNSHIDRPR